MQLFKDLNITAETRGMQGEKIKIERVFNTEITVHGYQLQQSKFNGNRLDIQIEYKGEMRVVFTGSTVLADMIAKVPKDAFPFKTTIVKENERYEFT